MRNKFCNVFPSVPFVLSLIWKLGGLIKVQTSRVLAPLRKVLTREISVHTCYLNSDRPWIFTVYATLDCGHEFREYGWCFSDLVNAYTETPEVAARRHRCHPCRDLAVTKKPVASVPVELVAVVA
jgi:hypothetical protein